MNLVDKINKAVRDLENQAYPPNWDISKATTSAADMNWSEWCSEPHSYTLVAVVDLVLGIIKENIALALTEPCGYVRRLAELMVKHGDRIDWVVRP